jgi:hypothetical protein
MPFTSRILKHILIFIESSNSMDLLFNLIMILSRTRNSVKAAAASCIFSMHYVLGVLVLDNPCLYISQRLARNRAS